MVRGTPNRQPLLKMAGDIIPPDETARGAAFDVALWEFLNTIDSLRSLLDDIAPLVNQADRSPDWRAIVDARTQALSPERREAAAPFLESVVGALASPALADVTRDAMREAARRARELASEGPEHLRREARQSIPADESQSFPKDPAVLDLGAELILQFIDNAVRPRPKLPLLLRSLVTSLVDAEELLIGRVVGAYYRLHPSAMGSDQKEFTLAEIQAMGSVEEVVSAAIDRRVDAFLLSSTADWVSFFDRNLKISLPQMALDWDETRELIQRRHLIVHAGGRVSARYKAALRGVQTPPLGTELAVDEPYLRRALDLITVFGLLVATTVWYRIVPDERAIASMRVSSRAYSEMHASRWEVVRALAAYQRQHITTTEDSRLIAQFNEWLARKRQGEGAPLHEEIEAFDDSALHRKFRMVRRVLLEDWDRAEDLAEEVIAAKDLSLSELEEWPVLEDLRTRPRFAKLLSRAQKRSIRELASPRPKRNNGGGK